MLFPRLSRIVGKTHDDCIINFLSSYTSGGKKVVEIPSWSMIKKCKVPSEDFYKSIGGLAYGTYSFIVKQFDSQNKLLLETGHIEFKINAATPVGHIRPTNVIC